ncbi:MAG: hypothetical protein PWQ22_477 [Archaeoglobaceae archaeon]|nr:hypothetical protein [Archaeoglobaceae archaeon]
MRFPIVAVLVLSLIASAMALETLDASNFSFEIKISPEKDYYFVGDEIQISYTIYPKSSSDKLKIGGEQGNPRTYSFKTPLLDPSGYWEVKYPGVSAVKQDFKGSSLSIEVKYYSIEEKGWEGVDYILVNLTGKVPDTDLRIKELEVLNATAEEVKSGALKSVKIKVVNKTAFLADLNSLKNKLSETRSNLDREGIKYDDKEFQNAEDLLSSAEKDLNAGNYGSADEKLKSAEEKISNLTSLADKIRAEEIYGKLSEIMDNITGKLEELQILIQALKGTENFTNLSSNYASLKSSADSLKSKLQSIGNYLEQGNFARAYEEAKKIENSVYKLKEDVEKLYSEVSATQNSGGFDFISALKSYLIYIVAVFLVLLLVFAITRFRKRRKWDELR